MLPNPNQIKSPFSHFNILIIECKRHTKANIKHAFSLILFYTHNKIQMESLSFNVAYGQKYSTISELISIHAAVQTTIWDKFFQSTSDNSFKYYTAHNTLLVNRLYEQTCNDVADVLCLSLDLSSGLKFATMSSCVSGVKDLSVACL